MFLHKKQASEKAGMLPGSVVYIGENPPVASKVLINIYDKKGYQSYELQDYAVIHDALAAGKNIWIDIVGLADNAQISKLCTELEIHPLVVEDIFHTGQRAKLEFFDNYLYIVFKLLHMPEGSLTYDTEQFSMVVKKNLLMTFRETDTHQFPSIYKSLGDDQSLFREQGSDYLTYLVMDKIVDAYFNFVELAAKQLEEMEDLLISDPEEISLKDLYTIKRRTIILRKTFTPLRDIIHLLFSEHGRFIDKKYHIYYRDLHDHVIRLLDSVNLHYEMTAGMLEIYLSTLNNPMNETMKMLTMFASIFIPLTFIAGLYGMNFKYMPELNWRYGYPTLLLLMVGLAAFMFYFFKRKKLV